MDIDVEEFNSRRARIEGLRAKLAEPAEIPLDRDTLRVGLTVIRQFNGGVRLIDDPTKDYIVMEHDPVVGPLATGRVPAGVRARCGS